MAIGLLISAGGLFGLSRLGAVSGPNDTVLWFIIIGLGLSPVMVGGAEVIIGNAPLELAGVAGGLTSTTLQIGGVLGTSVLGAVMSTRVDNLLPARWVAAHLPALGARQLAEAKGAVSVGVAPISSGMPRQVEALVTQIAHSTFMSGLDSAFLIASIVCLGAAALALLVKSGGATEDTQTVGSTEIPRSTGVSAV
jgi:hypothetical protein